MITKELKIVKANEETLIKYHGEFIIDKPIFQNVIDGIEEYYVVRIDDKIIDDFFLNVKRNNNIINLHISLNRFKECVDEVINYLSTKYSYITFTLYEDGFGKEKLDYLRNNYKVISDSVKLFDMTELVINIKQKN